MEYKNIKIDPSTPRTLTLGKEKKTERKPVPKTDDIPTLSMKQEDHSDPEQPITLQSRDGAKYRYIKTIGRGGMKVVLEVHDNDTMRNVAMALLPEISTQSMAAQNQFLREARITAGLEHPNIVPVHDIGIDSSGSPYFTMKLLRGRNLASVLKKLAENDPEYVERYPFPVLARVFTRICNAVAFAHSKGILHLDLKPENVQIGDYGEVLVLDWGLARKIPQEANVDPGQKSGTKTQKMKPLETPVSEDQVNGTPGYMAPEQVRGRRNACSRQTDIYALGAILYAMLTYHNPLREGTIEQMLRDTLSGNIVRPSQRCEGRTIPFGLEAVVMKAMNPEPSERYSDVRELRDEVVHFVSGYATEAEKAGPLKKLLLFTRRHLPTLLSGAFIMLLVGLLAVFAWREANREISLWIPVLTENFMKPGFPLDLCSFRDVSLKEMDHPWQLDRSGGLCVAKDQWLMTREAFPENIRISLELSFAPEKMKMLEIALIPASAGPEFSRKSPMITATLVRHSGLTAEILDCRNYFAPAVHASVPLRNWKKDKVTVTMEHENGFIVLKINKEPVMKTASLRLFGGGPVHVAFRADIPQARLDKLDIFRLAPPENATALLAGDTLLEERLYEPAIRRYLTVDDDRPGSKLAAKALQKAYLTALKLDSAELRSEYMVEIKKRLAEKYPAFDMSHFLIVDACTAWQSRNYPLAGKLMDRAFELDPDTQVVSYIMALPHEALPTEVQNMLIKLIRRTRGLSALDLSGYGFTSLQGIVDMKLISLNCSGNKLTSLRELAGMPLESLDCSNNRIVSIKALSGLPLHYLDCSNNRIRDFSPLKKLPLQRCNRTGNPAAKKR